MTTLMARGGGSAAASDPVQLPAGLSAPPATHPELVVFDLDMCMWSPEMFTLDSTPTEAVEGRPVLGEDGRIGSETNSIGSETIGSETNSESMIVGARTRRGNTVSLFPGALRALQELYLQRDTAWAGTLVAAASSSEEPSYSAACLDLLEILPGVKMREAFSFFAIGRTGELSSDKRTHFGKIQRESGTDFAKMLFFDDCNWGDHVGKIQAAHGVLGARTPNGMTYTEWRDALDMYAKERSR
jgi:magnesium-dependent phosphatase 1